MRAFLAIAACSLLAGCSDPAPAATQATPTSQTEIAGSPPWLLDHVYEMHLTEANTAGMRHGFPPFLLVPSDNCLGLVAGARIVQGYANVTWDADTLAAERLVVVLDFGVNERVRVEGTSPLSLDLGGLTLGSVSSVAGTSDGFRGSLLSTNLAGQAGAAVDQQFDLHLWLRYEAGEELVPETGFTCSPFTLPVAG